MSDVPDTPAGLYEEVFDARDIALRHHLNEVLSALHAVHVREHGGVPGCEFCDVWTTGRDVLARTLDRDQAEGKWLDSKGDSK